MQQGASRKRNRWDGGHEEDLKPVSSLEDEAIASLLATASSSDPNSNSSHRHDGKQRSDRLHPAHHTESYGNNTFRKDHPVSKPNVSDVGETGPKERIVKPSFALSGALCMYVCMLL